MAYTLTTPYPVPNPTKLDVADAHEERAVRNDPATVTALRVELEFRTGNQTDREYGKYVVYARNGNSGQLRPRSPADPDGGVGTPYPPGMVLQDMLEVSEWDGTTGGIATPTGLDTALAAWRSGSANARKNNLLTALRTLDIIQQGGPLAGAVS